MRKHSRFEEDTDSVFSNLEDLEREEIEQNRAEEAERYGSILRMIPPVAREDMHQNDYSSDNRVKIKSPLKDVAMATYTGGTSTLGSGRHVVSASSISSKSKSLSFSSSSSISIVQPYNNGGNKGQGRLPSWKNPRNVNGKVRVWA